MITENYTKAIEISDKITRLNLKAIDMRFTLINSLPKLSPTEIALTEYKIIALESEIRLLEAEKRGLR